MKTNLREFVIFALLSAVVFGLAGPSARVRAATREDPTPIDDAGDYREFAEAMMTRENLADCIVKMDALIDQAERAASASVPNTSPVRAETKNGLLFSFTTEFSRDAVTYGFVITRGGLELSFTDATKLAALFGDRVGLTHPIIVTATGESTYKANWFIKRSKWKAMNKMMLKVRVKNREEKDPQQAFAAAVLRELEARKAAQEKDLEKEKF